MPTNENALREQGEHKNLKIKLNSIINRGLVSYESFRQAWIDEHLDHTELELIEACVYMAKISDLNITRALRYLSGFNHEYL